MDTAQTNGKATTNGNGAIKVEDKAEGQVKAHDDQRIVDDATRAGVAMAQSVRGMAKRGIALTEDDAKRAAVKAAAKAVWAGLSK